MNRFIAYDVEEVIKSKSLTKAKSWYRAGFIEESNWLEIVGLLKSNLHTPKISMRIFLFVVGLFGSFTALGPFILVFMDGGIRAILIALGLILLFINEAALIKDKKHYKSGITEALYYVGASFFVLGVLGFELEYPIIYFVSAFIVSLLGSIRYLDLPSIVIGVGSYIVALFFIFDSIIAVIPFVILVSFVFFYLLSQYIQKRLTHQLWTDHFVVFDSLCLLLIYLGGNHFALQYFGAMMGSTDFIDDGNVMLTILINIYTYSLPLVYIAWGIWKRKIIFFRIGLVIFSLTTLLVITNYFQGHFDISALIIGGVLIIVTLLIMKYMKRIRNGYTREKILTEKWNDSDFGAFLASQVLGGHHIEVDDTSFTGEGGEFGGGGASGKF